MNGLRDGEDNSLLERLRRRKVVQWGIVYAAGAWGFLQGLSYVSSTFDWPRRIQQLATLGLLLGLPIILVLAWYHGDRGHQRVARNDPRAARVRSRRGRTTLDRRIAVREPQ